MTCQSALELLLDAEPFELATPRVTPLGVHLRGCVRCRRVATQLMHDTQRLAVAMTLPIPARRPARRALLVSFAPVAAIAAMAFAVVLGTGPAEAPLLESVRSEPPAALAAAMRVPNADPVATRPAVVKSVTHRAFARPVPVHPVRLIASAHAAPPLTVEMNGVAVTPPAGMRATVMHTSNPKLVVVWLH